MGLTPGSDLGKLGKGAAVLVFASDLHEEAPIWWLRLKQAAERGLTLIVAGARATRLDKYAAHVLRYAYGEEEKVLKGLIAGQGEAGLALQSAADVIVFYGADGMGLAQTEAAASLCAELLVKTNHFGRPNNGLVAVWPHANDQGAAELEVPVSANLAEELGAAVALYIAGVDPAGDSPALKEAVQRAGFVVVQELYMTETARNANVVLPVQASMEREGSLVSGERRVQRFYRAVPPLGESMADYEITAAIVSGMGAKLSAASAEAVFNSLAQIEPAFSGLDYAQLNQTEAQWPVTGRAEAYFSGTVVENKDGLGVTLPLLQNGKVAPSPAAMPAGLKVGKEGWLAVPVTRLYDQAITLHSSELLKGRIGERALSLHPDDAEKLGLAAGDRLILSLDGQQLEAAVDLDAGQPQGVVLVRRSMGISLAEPVEVNLHKIGNG